MSLEQPRTLLEQLVAEGSYTSSNGMRGSSTVRRGWRSRR